MTLADRWPKPRTILAHYQRSKETLSALSNHLLAPATPQSPFYLMTQEEMNQAVDEMALELSHEIVLLLTASFEAEFQADFHDRVSRKKKDQISKEFRRMMGDHRGRRHAAKPITFEAILDVWRKNTGHAKAIDDLKQLVQFRHWLAHGRYWVQKSGLSNPDPFDAWQRGRAVHDALLGAKA